MSLTSIVNAASNISNTLFNQSPKEFYSLRDFYNFIKKRQNAPMAMRHFTIIPKPEVFSADGNGSKVWDYIFTDTNLARFALLVQRVELPRITINNTISNIATPYGRYSPIPNGPPTGSQDTFTITFLQTATPVIQTFVVPWFYQCLRTNNYKSGKFFNTGNTIDKIKDAFTNSINDVTNSILQSLGSSIKLKNSDSSATKDLSQYPCPKMTLDFKFYRMDQIAGIQALMNPNYVYRLTGVYPVGFDAPRPQHTTDANHNLKRTVTFKYNNITCIPNAYYQTMLYNGGNSAFAYKTQSPVQILNALNSATQDVSSIIDNIKSI